MNLKNIFLVFLGFFSSGAFAGGGNNIGSVIIHVQEESGKSSSAKVVTESFFEIEGPSSAESRENITRGDCSKNSCLKYSTLAGLYVFFGSVFFGTLALHALEVI